MVLESLMNRMSLAGTACHKSVTDVVIWGGHREELVVESVIPKWGADRNKAENKPNFQIVFPVMA